jgi:hypothetical protein
VQTKAQGFRLIPETATFLDLCVAACCGWIFLRLAAKVKGGATKELDETLLRMLRQKENLAVPRGPRWLPQASQDITSLGSGTNLTIASGIAVGFLCLQRRFRAAAFLVVSLGSQFASANRKRLMGCRKRRFFQAGGDGILIFISKRISAKRVKCVCVRERI